MDFDVRTINRVDFGDDQSFFEELVRVESNYAKKERGQRKYEDESFSPRVIIVGHNYEIARIPTPWKDDDEKRYMVAKIGYLARVLDVKALMLTSDMRMVKMEDLRAFLKLPTPNYEGLTQDEMVAAYEKEWHHSMKPYDHKVSNLPRHVWTEGVHVALKSQHLPVIGKMRGYTRGSFGQVMWMPPNDVKYDRIEMDLIPDWWDIKDDDPNLAVANSVTVDVLDKLLEKMKREAARPPSPFTKPATT